MTLLQRVELLAEDVKKLEGEGGGGDLSAYLTKSEASSTYETQTGATASLALKADKATTYTKTEVDNAIAAAGGDLDLTPIAITLDNGLFPEDKLSVIQKHLPIRIDGINLIFIGSSGSTEYIYGSFYGQTQEDQLSIKKIYIINSANRSVRNWGRGGNIGDSVSIVCGQNFSSFLLEPSRWQQSTNTYGKARELWNSANLNQVYTIGLYYCTSAVAATLTNCPTTNAFTLINNKWINQGSTAQTIIEHNGSAIYMRQQISDEWQKFSCDSEILSQTSVSDSMYSSTTLVPLEVGIPTSCDVPWSHIMKENDFTLLKTVNDTTYAVRFQYSQTTGRNSFMYKGSLVLPSGSYLHTYIVEMSPAANQEDPTSTVSLIGTFETALAS